MKIAIIGSGVSGMVAAYLLHQDHDITLFEANDYIGGHTHTIDVTQSGTRYAVDTGFIVFNEVTYPNFLKLIRRLGVEYQPSPMTFSVKCERTGLEYSPHSLNSLFIQRKNLFSPSFYRMIADIFKFRRRFERLEKGKQGALELGPYLTGQGYSRRFIEHFIIPLGAALWSADPHDVRNFPLEMFVRFFKNHGFLEVHQRFQWKAIRGGSQRYVERLTSSYAHAIRLNTPVKAITRHPNHVEVQTGAGQAERFDHVVIAAHSDQALAMLTDPSSKEKEILAAFPYQENLAVLHTDTRVLPKHRAIWSSWNYLVPRLEMGRGVITYAMNILQTIDAPVEFCVSLNLTEGISRDRVLGKYLYHHPIYRKNAPVMQKRHKEISGVNRTHYCGAYWGYGFHEDGVNSALAACRFFGKGL